MLGEIELSTDIATLLTANEQWRDGAKVALIFIARGVDGGLPAVREFLEAYRYYEPGHPHRLYIVAKGWQNASEFGQLSAMAAAAAATLIEVPDDGFDWGAYMRACVHTEEPWLCLLNTHSRPHSTGWLNLMWHVASTQGIGAAGATGSWSSWAGQVPLFEAGLNEFFLYFLRFGRAIYHWVINRERFIPFPNPHLRSNGLLIRRELFVNFCQRHRIPQTKRDSHMLESGRHGLSRFLLEQGLQLAVVGADGIGYESDQWSASGTFRTPMSQNLLIEDNQTRSYLRADRRLKRRLEKAAWGKPLSS